MIVVRILSLLLRFLRATTSCNYLTSDLFFFPFPRKDESGNEKLLAIIVYGGIVNGQQC